MLIKFEPKILIKYHQLFEQKVMLHETEKYHIDDINKL